jgi:hypothetical protein
MENGVLIFEDSSIRESAKVKLVYQDVVRIPLYAYDLKLRTKLKVFEYASKIEQLESSRINNLIILWPDFNYPDQYLPDRKFDYWSERNKDYQDCISVMLAIDKSLPADKKFKHIFTDKEKHQEKPAVKAPEKKSFPDLLSHSDPPKLAECLKNEFSYEIGKIIKLMIIVLEEEKILNSKPRGMFTIIYNSIKEYFGTYIGTPQSIRKWIYHEPKSKSDYDAVKNKIKKILESI